MPNISKIALGSFFILESFLNLDESLWGFSETIAGEVVAEGVLDGNLLFE